jgi:transposase
MPKRTRVVIGGVDTHGRTHHAAVIDQQGRLLGDREFAADSSGYRQLLGWLSRHGQVDSVGVEGTGSYGAGLTRFLLDAGVKVVEVDRPDRRIRRQRGKSDPIDAEAAARAVLAGTATAAPKRRDGIVEAIRVLRTARRGASKARTAAINQLKALVVTAPAPVREELDDRSVSVLTGTCARFRPEETGLADPVHASKAALQAIARRIQLLEAEIGLADQRLATLVGRAAPRLLGLLAIGNDHAGQLLVTAGQHPERLRGEAAFAHLCGSPPSPPAPARPTATGCTAAGTATPTGPCTWPSWSGCGFVPVPAPMSTDGARKACPNPRSCAASSAIWPARSTTPWSPTSRHSTPLDDLDEHPLRLVRLV